MMRKGYWWVFATHPKGGERYLGKVLQHGQTQAINQGVHRFGKSLVDGEVISVRAQVP